MGFSTEGKVASLRTTESLKELLVVSGKEMRSRLEEKKRDRGSLAIGILDVLSTLLFV